MGRYSGCKTGIAGLGQGRYYSSWGGRPQFIELYATGDIDDLSKYWIYNFRDGSSSANYSYRLSGSIKKGEYILLYEYAWYFAYYFTPVGETNNDYYPTNLYAKSFNVGNLLTNGLRYGDDAFSIDIEQEGTTAKKRVDVVGVIGEDGTGKNWEYYKGWMKRKDNNHY
jgi:hypothetical protein